MRRFFIIYLFSVFTLCSCSRGNKGQTDTQPASTLYVVDTLLDLSSVLEGGSYQNNALNLTYETDCRSTTQYEAGWHAGESTAKIITGKFSTCKSTEKTILDNLNEISDQCFKVAYSISLIDKLNEQCRPRIVPNATDKQEVAYRAIDHRPVIPIARDTTCNDLDTTYVVSKVTGISNAKSVFAIFPKCKDAKVEIEDIKTQTEQIEGNACYQKGYIYGLNLVVQSKCDVRGYGDQLVGATNQASVKCEEWSYIRGECQLDSTVIEDKKKCSDMGYEISGQFCINIQNGRVCPLSVLNVGGCSLGGPSEECNPIKILSYSMAEIKPKQLGVITQDRMPLYGLELTIKQCDRTDAIFLMTDNNSYSGADQYSEELKPIIYSQSGYGGKTVNDLKFDDVIIKGLGQMFKTPTVGRSFIIRGSIIGVDYISPEKTFGVDLREIIFL